MPQTLPTTLAILYGISVAASFVALLPTLKDLWLGKSNIQNYSYVLWTVCSLFGVLYGVFVLRDSLFEFVAILQLLACTANMVVRFKHAKRTRKTRGVRPPLSALRR